MKKRILFVSYKLDIGGTTSALLSLLNSFDYNSYEVDLLLNIKEGDFIKELPKEVNVLESRFFMSREIRVIKRVLNMLRQIYKYVISGIIWDMLAFKLIKSKNNTELLQRLAIKQAKAEKTGTKEYDVAIGFMELWPNAYTAIASNAKRKIGIVHPNYLDAGLNPEIDFEVYKKMDKVILISNSCKTAFQKAFPSLADRTVMIENVIPYEKIINRSKETLGIELFGKSSINLITVCRLQILTKGLDRMVNVAKRLVDEGCNFKWYIVGDGYEKGELLELINKNSLSNNIILLGTKNNPYPYIKQADLFVLASRYEGKPITITEAQILNCPALVTEYGSAREQIINGYEGQIVENSEDGLYQGLKDLLQNPKLLKIYRENLQKKTFNKVDIIDKYYSAINNDCVKGVVNE